MRTSNKIEAQFQVQRATEQALNEVIAYLQSTDTPRSEEAHKIIDHTLEKYDCESPEGHIVAGGVQSVEPHEYGHGSLQAGTPIVIDIYPRSKITGYFADMTRTVCIGQPSDKLQRMYNSVIEAQETAFSMIKPGVYCAEIQEAVEQVFESAGYLTSGVGKEFPFAEGFVHSVGHGVGKDIHMSPHIGRSSNDVLCEGDVVTIEPGLYYKNIGGIRVEDMVLVTDVGIQNFTNFSKKFIL